MYIQIKCNLKKKNKIKKKLLPLLSHSHLNITLFLLYNKSKKKSLYKTALDGKSGKIRVNVIISFIEMKMKI